MITMSILFTVNEMRSIFTEPCPKLILLDYITNTLFKIQFDVGYKYTIEDSVNRINEHYINILKRYSI